MTVVNYIFTHSCIPFHAEKNQTEISYMGELLFW